MRKWQHQRYVQQLPLRKVFIIMNLFYMNKNIVSYYEMKIWIISKRMIIIHIQSLYKSVGVEKVTRKGFYQPAPPIPSKGTETYLLAVFDSEKQGPVDQLGACRPTWGLFVLAKLSLAYYPFVDWNWNQFDILYTKLKSGLLNRTNCDMLNAKCLLLNAVSTMIIG